MLRTRVFLILIVIVLIGFFLRLHHLAVVPLRGDEAFSALYWSQMPVQQSLFEIASIEPHPPLTYIIFNLWHRVIGGIQSPFALRMLGVLINLLGIPAMYALTMRITHNYFLSFLSAFVWAIHPFEIWHSQDFRNYAIWAGLSVISVWFGIRLIHSQLNLNDSPQKQKSRFISWDVKLTDWILYTLFAIVTALTFYTEVLTLGALGLYAIITQRSRPSFLLRFLCIQVCTVLLVGLSLLMFQGELLMSGGYGGNVQSFNLIDYFTRFIPILTFGDTIPFEIWVPLSFSLCLLMIILFRYDTRKGLLVSLFILIPLISLGIVSLKMSIFHPRYVISIVPAFVLLLILGLNELGARLSCYLRINKRILLGLLVSPYIIIAISTLHNYYTNPSLIKSPAWDELAVFLNKNVKTNDLVIQLSTDAAFGYYYDGSAEDIGLPASPQQSQQDIVDILETAKDRYESIYVVSNAILDWPNANVVEEWANQNMQLVRLSNASGLGIRQYKRWQVDDISVEQPLANFEDGIYLVGFDLFEEPLPTGEIVLWLYWEPQSQLDKSLKSFVHLVGDIRPDTASPLWSQDDQFPQEGQLDTMTWPSKVIYREVYYLSTGDLISGDYSLWVGWYNPQTNKRLQTENGSDVYELTDLSYP